MSGRARQARKLLQRKRFAAAVQIDAGPLAQALGKSTRIMPSTALMPQRMACRAETSGKKYMSLKQVMPPRSISAMARSLPSRT